MPCARTRKIYFNRRGGQLFISNFFERHKAPRALQKILCRKFTNLV